MPLIQPITRPLLSPLARGVGEGGVGGNLPIPSGFGWTPPVGVYRSNAGFGTNFRASDWKVASTKDLYVDINAGNDSTGNGTIGAPYKTFFKAWQVTNGLPDTSITIYVAAGVYNRQQINGNGVSSDGNKNINVIATGGRAVFSSHFEPLTWSGPTSGMSSATRTNVVTVRDTKYPNGDGTYPKLTLVASSAACTSTPGSWYTDGTTVYVHPQDGRAIDSQIRVYAAVTNTLLNNPNQYYFENIDFEGGVSGALRWAGTYSSTRRLVLNGCAFRYGSDNAGSGGNGLSAWVGATVICYNCTAERNDQDGFNYHQTTAGAFGFVEIGCVGRNNGLSADDDNGSTSHDSCVGMRVNCSYSNNIGPLCIDVNAAQTWNLGIACSTSLATSGVNNACYAAGNQSGHTAKMWLDTCTGSGSDNATTTADTSNIYTRNCTLSGASIGNVSAY